MTHALERRADAVRVLERAPVERDAHVDLASRRTVREVVLDRLICRDVRAHTTVEVRLVVGLYAFHEISASQDSSDGLETYKVKPGPSVIICLS